MAATMSMTSSLATSKKATFSGRVQSRVGAVRAAPRRQVLPCPSKLDLVTAGRGIGQVQGLSSCLNQLQLTEEPTCRSATLLPCEPQLQELQLGSGQQGSSGFHNSAGALLWRCRGWAGHIYGPSLQQLAAKRLLSLRPRSPSKLLTQHTHITLAGHTRVDRYQPGDQRSHCSQPRSRPFRVPALPAFQRGAGRPWHTERRPTR